MKNVARTCSRSRMSSRRRVLSTTRLSRPDQSSGRTTPESASAWKYSSMSNVSAFFMRSHFGEKGLVGTRGIDEELGCPLEAAHERHAGRASQELGGERGPRRHGRPGLRGPADAPRDGI